MDRTVHLAHSKKVRPASGFKERPAALRKARGPIQTELAEKIESSQRAVSRYETIAERAPAPFQTRLAHGSGVPIDELLLGIKPTRVANLDDDPETRRLRRKFREAMELPEHNRSDVIRFVYSLAAKAAARDRDSRGRRAVG